MKIAILTSGILPVPAVQGGAVENLVDFYLEYNDQHRLHDITVYSIWHPAAKDHVAMSSAVNHYHYIDTTSIWAKTKRKIYGMLHRHEYYNYHIEYFYEQAYRHLRKHHYDCIILENRPGYVYKLSLYGKDHIVLHLHNDLLNENTPVSQYIYNHLQKVLTVSNFIQQRVETIGGNPSKITTVYNGIDLQQFSRKEHPMMTREELGLSEGDFVLVYSGRINKDKGISELIDAMLLLQDIPQIKLLIIGSSFFGNSVGEDDFIRSLKKKSKDIAQNILFTGFVPYHIIPDYLQMADVAVIPSVWDDPLPTTVLEAQSMGLPIIASNRGGIPEEIGKDNAVIVNTENDYVGRLAQAIREVYKNTDLRKKMAKASLEHSKYFNKERFAQDFFNALKDFESYENHL